MQEFDNSKHETRSEAEIAHLARSAHADFTEKVPLYSKDAWNPIDAIRSGRGSCMAEALYVAGCLISEGINANDISIGFSKTHGEDQPIGFVGKTAKKYAHTTMYVGTADIEGRPSTMMLDFRANSANDIGVAKLVEEQSADEHSFSEYGIYPLEDAVQLYGGIESSRSSIPTIDDLVALARGEYQNMPIDEGDGVRFDEEF